MKNIFILDCSGTNLFKNFIENPDFFVIGAIVFHQEEKQLCLSHGIKEVYTLEEMDFLQEYIQYLNFTLIETFRHTQRKVEFGMMRSLNSNMLIANKYYNALCYFSWFFQEFKIDCIFVNGIPHGYIPETILLDMGKHLRIPTYCIFPITSSYSSLLRYDTGENIPVVNPIDTNLLTKQIFDKSKPSYNQDKIRLALGKSSTKYLIYKGGGADNARYSFLPQKKNIENTYGVL